ncbi:G-protein coupled receptor 1-like [Protopterus annectens]|uniref:G-protein coupled receptor 1-like n=1 Tax=Protopterus annectens TaxID=7888 RepID=UPI001CFA1C78|nr:G-protein coupled receptor 1-like [Protopterus annectens]XP_043916444.1 G-protein coupled receptor 1-like [Protopterus annectens]
MDVITTSGYSDENYTYEYEYSYSILSEDEDMPEKQLSSIHIFSIVVYIVAFLVGVPGNAVVIWITGWKMKRTVSTVWFLNLAIADFIFVFFLPFSVTYIILSFHWPFGTATCKLWSALVHQNLYASVMFVVVITLDRYVHAVHPSFSNRCRSVRNSWILCSVVWVTSLLLSIPNFYFRDTVSYNGKTVCYYNFHEHNHEMRLRLHIVLVSMRFAIAYLLPLLTIIISYTLLIIRIKSLETLTTSNIFRTATAIVVVFFFCWTPYHIFSLLELTIHHSNKFNELLHTAIPIVTSLAFLNSCCNPVLYVFFAKNFKLAFKSSIAKIMKQSIREVSQSGTVSESTYIIEMNQLTLPNETTA